MATQTRFRRTLFGDMPNIEKQLPLCIHNTTFVLCSFVFISAASFLSSLPFSIFHYYLIHLLFFLTNSFRPFTTYRLSFSSVFQPILSAIVHHDVVFILILPKTTT